MNSHGARVPYPALPTHSSLKSAHRFLFYVVHIWLTVYYRDNTWGGGTGSWRTTRIFRGATVLQLLGNLTFSDYVFKIFSSKTLDIFAPAPNLPMGRAYVLNFILWNKIQYTIVVQKHATAWVKNIFLMGWKYFEFECDTDILTVWFTGIIRTNSGHLQVCFLKYFRIIWSWTVNVCLTKSSCLYLDITLFFS